MLSRNTHYYNSSLLFRLLAFACIPALLFVIVNIALGFFKIYPIDWLKELNFNLQNGLPFFLFLTGSFIRNKKFRIPVLIFFPVFFISYVLKVLDFWTEAVDVNGIKWVLCPAILGLLITYIIYFFIKRSKTLLDYIKFIWFVVICYITLSVYFHIGFRVMLLYEISTWIAVLLMVLGLVHYFRKPVL